MILPIGHERTITHFPWVTTGLILVNTVIFLITLPLSISQVKEIEKLRTERTMTELEHNSPHLLHESSRETIPEQEDSRHEIIKKLDLRLHRAESNLVYRKYGYTPSKLKWYTLFTSLFLHAGLLHLIGNMWFLYLIGASIEDVWGRWCFLSIYLAAGILACLIHGLVYKSSGIPVIGASGAIAGLMGAFMIRNYRVRIRFLYFFLIFIYPLYGTFYLPAYVALGGWFALQLLFGAVSLGCAAGVAYWAHIGGFLIGVAVAVILRTQKIEERYIAPKREERLEAVKLHPKLSQAFEARDRGCLDEASVLLRELVFTEPNNIDAHTELVNIWISIGNIRKAGNEYDKIVGILSQNRNTDSLIETYRDIVQLGLLDQLSAENQYRLANTFSERELYEEATNLYRCLIKNSPDHELAPLAIFKCAMLLLHKLGKPDLAFAAFQYILEKYPRIDWKNEVLLRLGRNQQQA